jgi:hypothetical protein
LVFLDDILVTQQHEAETLDLLRVSAYMLPCALLQGVAPTDFAVSVLLIPKPVTGYEPEPVQCISHCFHNIAVVDLITRIDVISVLCVVNSPTGTNSIPRYLNFSHLK